MPPTLAGVTRTAQPEGDALGAAADRAQAHGVSREHVIVDPGFGFGNVVEHEAELVRRMNELVALGYPSIGCSPCTHKVAPGEDPRSGRWKGWDKTECGIHVPGTPDIGDDLPPEFDPVF